MVRYYQTDRKRAKGDDKLWRTIENIKVLGYY